MASSNFTNRRLRCTVQTNLTILGLFLSFQSSLQAQVIRDYRVTCLKPFQFEWVGECRPLRPIDTVKVLMNNKVQVMELRGKTLEYAEARKLTKLPLKVGDTLQVIKKP